MSRHGLWLSLGVGHLSPSQESVSLPSHQLLLQVAKLCEASDLDDIASGIGVILVHEPGGAEAGDHRADAVVGDVDTKFNS